MEKILHFRSVLLVSFLLFTSILQAQLRVEYKEKFTTGNTYCPTDNQYKNWGAFRTQLDTSKLPFYSVTVSGDNNSGAIAGKTCADATEVKRLAQAMKSGNNYSTTCNGNTWKVSTGCVGGCAQSADAVELTVDGTTCTCGNPGWSLRPCIGNSNWGGINTAGCGGPTQVMNVYFEYIGVKNNLGVSQSGFDACSNSQDVKASFFNQSTNDVDSFTYYYSVNGTVTGPVKVTGKVAKLKDTTITIISGLSLTRGTNNTVKTWISTVNNTLDSFPSNDTASSTIYFYGTPTMPVATDKTVCGSQAVLLEATPGNAGDTIIWYTDYNKTNYVGTGTKVWSDYLASGTSYTFWAYPYADFSPNGKLETTFANNNGQSGNMFDIIVKGGGITIDSMWIHASSTSTELFEVYLRKGSYTDAGASTTASMWTKVFSGNVNTLGTGNRTPVDVNIKLDGLTKYGMYVQFPNSTSMNYTNGTGSNQIFENSEIRIEAGYGVAANWGGTFNPRVWNGAVKYGRAICPGLPDSAVITVNAAPYGSRLEPGTPFQTSPKNSGVGMISKPHVVAFGDTLSFNLRTPAMYNASDYGNTWKVTNVEASTLSGRVVNTYTWTNPVGGSGSAEGHLDYTPDTSVVDSIIELRVSIQDIGTTQCDTLIKHYVYVAPLPVPDFSRNAKICDGGIVEFTNLSSIKSGFIEYKWFFGDGDSSDAVEPVKQYQTYGTYVCRMNAISSLYGYVRSKFDTITVTQIPDVRFKITHACETQSHQFTNQSTVNSGSLTYSWNFGDNSSNSSLKDPTHKYATPGQYKVTLTATANGCSNSLTKNAYLFPKPKADFTFPSTGVKYCTNTPVSFQNRSTISSGSVGAIWTFEGGEFGTVDEPVHTFDQPGAYNIKLMAISEFGCQDSVTKPLTIFEAPKVAFTHSQVCDHTPTEFTNNTPQVSGSVANYYWSFGDGSTSTAMSPSHQYTQLGPKTVKFVVKQDNSCSDSTSMLVNVGTQAIVDFDVANTCSGKEVQFDNKTTYSQGTIAYKWNFGGVDSSTLADPRYTFYINGSNTYNITLTAVVDGGCESTLTKSMTVFELPKCDFTVTDDWTPGDGYRTIRVAANNTTYPFYRFKFSDGGSLNTSGGVYQFPYDGEFTITMIARNQVDCECESSQLKAIRNSLGTVDLNNSDVRLFPNPSTGVVNVVVSESNQIKTVDVYNLLGELMTANVKMTGTGRAQVDFGDAADGIYLVKVTTNTGSVTRRMTIHK